MTDTPSPSTVLRPLRRVRQTRQFLADAPISPDALDAIADVARWSGSSQNTQPWRFITMREPETLRAIWQAGLPNTRALETAVAGIGIVMPVAEGKAVSYAFDEARAAERILVAAALLGLAGGLMWLASGSRPAVGELLGVPEGWSLRTVIALGHPRGSRPKSARGTARLPRSETVYAERWDG